jgi:hypothetical protein
LLLPPFPLSLPLLVPPPSLFDAFLLLAFLQLAIKRIALPIPALHPHRPSESSLVMLLSFRQPVRVADPQPSRIDLRHRLLLALLLQLCRQLLAQRLHLELNLVVGHVVVFELDAQLHAAHFDAALAFVLQNRCIRLRVSHVGGGRGGGFGEGIVARSDVGEVALDVAVGARAARRLEANTVVHGEYGGQR